jgi:uncharacterized protein (TIGR00251 family)
MIALSAHAGGTVLPVRAHPGARKASVGGAHAGALRIAVTAPADQGKANAAIAALLAETLGCKPAQVVLLSGAASRQKRFLIQGIAPGAVRQRLAPLLAAEG